MTPGAPEHYDARDSAGHYAVLGIDPSATAEEITAAYRRAAKRLHPDMPRTGTRAGFLRLQEAYQVLGDPIRRAEYDQAARADTSPAWRQEEQALPFVPAVSWRMPSYLGLAMLVITVLAFGQAAFYIFSSAKTFRSVEQALTAVARPPPASPPATPPSQVAPAVLVATHFVSPGPAPAVLWRRGEGTTLIRAGQLAGFAPVEMLREGDAAGLAEIRASGGEIALIEAIRLQRGDAGAARKAACLYNAGSPPRGGALLTAPRGGPVQVTVENQEERPAVFKLRDAAQAVAAAVYLGPRGRAAIGALPAGRYRAEFAVGDVWSAACGMFMAGMRAQRLPEAQDLSGPKSFVISAAIRAEDISDDAFSRD